MPTKIVHVILLIWGIDWLNNFDANMKFTLMGSHMNFSIVDSSSVTLTGFELNSLNWSSNQLSTTSFFCYSFLFYFLSTLFLIQWHQMTSIVLNWRVIMIAHRLSLSILHLPNITVIQQCNACYVWVTCEWCNVLALL